MRYRDHGRVAQLQGQHHRTRLHARALFGHDEFAAGKVGAGLGQQGDELQGKDMRAVCMLNQRLICVRAQAVQRRQRPGLSGIAVALRPGGEFVGVCRVLLQGGSPGSRDRKQLPVQVGAQ
ncbi:hypothetical protein G6F68_012546 [Rhizopus microsporus]|nr:hypothetical protein G6F68_012546 [Rhizopus microsporus]